MYKKHDRVQFIKDFDQIYPDAYIKKGETGRIIDINYKEEHYEILLDNYYPGLDRWDNILYFSIKSNYSYFVLIKEYKDQRLIEAKKKYCNAALNVCNAMYELEKCYLEGDLDDYLTKYYPFDFSYDELMTRITEWRLSIIEEQKTL